MDLDVSRPILADALREKSEAEALLAKTRRELASREKLLRSVTAQLTQQTTQLNVILDNVLAGIVQFDEDFFVVRANKFAEAMFGYDEGGLFGSSATDMFSAPVESVMADSLMCAQANSDHGCDSYRGVRSDHTNFPAEISIAQIEIKSRPYSVWFVRDITDRKRREVETKKLEQELRQAQKLESLGTLASGIAHEINTPIQFVGDNLLFLDQAFEVMLSAGQAAKSDAECELLMQSNEDSASDDFDFYKEEVPVAIKQSLEGVSRVSEIVRSVRDFSHPGSKDRAMVDINESVRTTVTISRNQWKYVAEIEMELAEDVPHVHCVAGEINQVLLNLFVNAAQAIEEKDDEETGRIIVRTRTAGDSVIIEVQDTGCGIPQNIRDRIFDPFFTTKEVGNGTGQGLSIAHSVVVAKHNGKLSFYDVPSGGTVFVVSLPIGGDMEASDAA